jgi:hypothetical protein
LRIFLLGSLTGIGCDFYIIKMGKRIFIAYRSNKQDTALAEAIEKGLKALGHDVFVSSSNLFIGQDWTVVISEKLENCQYFICLLSAEALESDMVTSEITRAWENNKKTGKFPIIMPVHVKLDKYHIHNYDIFAYLRKIQAKDWFSEFDTESLIREIAMQIDAGEELEAESSSVVVFKDDNTIPMPNAPLETPYGTVVEDSPFYVLRKGEDEFINRVTEQGALLRIKAPRQFGKTSLLARTINKAKELGYHAVVLNFQAFADPTLSNLDMLLIQICKKVSKNLGLDDKVREVWDDDLLDIKMKFSTYFEEHILPKLDRPLLLAIDEADRLFDYKLVSLDFFSNIRSINESTKYLALWKNLKIAMTYATDSTLAINDLNQSPFNVGHEKVLQEFTQQEVMTLVRRHSLTLNMSQVTALMDLIGGHPYLVRKCLYDLAKDEYSFDYLLKEAASETGPLNDHLQRVYFNVCRFPETKQTLKDILLRGKSSNENQCNNLRDRGLVKFVNQHYVPSLNVYKIYLANRL